MTGRTVDAWWFSAEPRVPRTGEPVVVGETQRVEPPIVLCVRGLHASRRVLDALTFAGGPWLWRVRLTGEIVEGADKIVASERTPLWGQDVTMLLHEFACRCAERALRREREAGREPDPRSWAAVETKRRWMHGGATDEELIDARNAAWDAAEHTAFEYAKNSDWESAGYAAWESARSAARATVRAADLDAAWAVAWDTAWYAAGYALRVGGWFRDRLAEREWQERELLRMLAEIGAPVDVPAGEEG